MARHDLPARTGDVWHGLVSARPGAHYAFCAHGPNEPENGHRFEPAVMLLDPYARELSKAEPLRSRVVDGGAFDWNGDRPPATPWRDTVIYELHVKGYTRLHPDVPEGWRGASARLCAPGYSNSRRRATLDNPVPGLMLAPSIPAPVSLMV